MNQLADPAPGRPAGISAEEWQLRQDLAACCQLADVYGMSDMAGTHISARLPGPDHVRLQLHRARAASRDRQVRRVAVGAQP